MAEKVKSTAKRYKNLTFLCIYVNQNRDQETNNIKYFNT